MNTNGPTSRFPASATEPVMAMLARHVPLSLIMDLASPSGPRSHEILLIEGEPDDRWWERR